MCNSNNVMSTPTTNYHFVVSTTALKTLMGMNKIDMKNAQHISEVADLSMKPAEPKFFEAPVLFGTIIHTKGSKVVVNTKKKSFVHEGNIVSEYKMPLPDAACLAGKGALLECFDLAHECESDLRAAIGKTAFFHEGGIAYNGSAYIVSSIYLDPEFFDKAALKEGYTLADVESLVPGNDLEKETLLKISFVK